MNKPYVKVYDASGVLTNPIKGSYISKSPNRSQRRFTAPRFRGNHKGVSLTIVPGKPPIVYRRVIQELPDGKQIQHYLLKQS